MGFYRIKKNYVDIHYQYISQSQYHISPRQEQMGSNASSAHILLVQRLGYETIAGKHTNGSVIGRRVVTSGKKQQRLAISHG